MAFPEGWPPRPATARRSLRFFVSGTATANYDANAFLFADDTGAVTYDPLPFVKPGSTDSVHVGGTFDPGTGSGDGAVVGSGSPVGGGQNINDAAPRTHDDQPNTQEAVPKPMAWSQAILIRNTGGAELFFSFDGVNDHGRLAAGESQEFKDRYEAGIALKSAVGTDFEVEAW